MFVNVFSGGQRSSTVWQLQMLVTQGWKDATQFQIMPCWSTRDGLLGSSSITMPSLARPRRMSSLTMAPSKDLTFRENQQWSTLFRMSHPLYSHCGYTTLYYTIKLNSKLSPVTAAVRHWFFLLLPRLLRSLIGLKRVIINAAHFLVMKNKEFYRFYQTEPFLETVRGNTFDTSAIV